MAQSIREFTAKSLLLKHGGLCRPSVLVGPETALEIAQTPAEFASVSAGYDRDSGKGMTNGVPGSHKSANCVKGSGCQSKADLSASGCMSSSMGFAAVPDWVLGKRLVVKPDVLLKRRGVSGLITLDVDWLKAKDILEEKRNSTFTVDGLEGTLSHFIIEEYLPHERDAEWYVAIRTLRQGDEILFSTKGGVNVGHVESHAAKLLIAVKSDGAINMDVDFTSLTKPFGLDQIITDSVCHYIKRLYHSFCSLHFSFLEMNPVCYDQHTQSLISLDCAAKLDHTAHCLCEDLWGPDIEFPGVFGRSLTPAEEYIRELDSKTGASLKLTVLNPMGRVWTLIAGGGASVVFGDTVCDFGVEKELGNYGEYSGAPSEVTTYEYAKTVLGLVTADGTYRPDGKILLIGGGIANFTSVADTFKGIIRAMKEFQDRLKSYHVTTFVRRGGPGYQDGLKLMRDLGEQLGIPIYVFGPETYITAIVTLSLSPAETFSCDGRISPIIHESSKKHDMSKWGVPSTGNSPTASSIKEASPTANGAFQTKGTTAGRFAQDNAATQSVTVGNISNTDNTKGPWCETSMTDLEFDPSFTARVQQVLHPSSVDAFVDEVSNGISLVKPLFTKDTRCVVWGLQTRAVQEMLDFDHVCGRAKPSVAAIVYEFSVSHLRPFYFGTEEIFIPICQTLEEALKVDKAVDTLVNFASMRSAADVTRLTMKYSHMIRTIAVIAEGVPERLARELGVEAKSKGVSLIGPATVGGMRPGAFRIGNTGGSLENVMNASLYRHGSVGFVTKSGGMLNELNNILSNVTDGACEGVAIGGDRFPGTSMLDHLLRYEADSSVKILMLLGEVGGDVEYEVVEALKQGKLKKPLVAWCVGTCAQQFSTEVSFGHAGAWAGSDSEHASAKNDALKKAGAVVPASFQHLGQAVRDVFEKLVRSGCCKRRIDGEAPRVPMDYGWAKKLGLVRRPKGFVSTISDDRGEELVYAGWPISKVLQNDMGVGGVISLLWFKRPLPDYCYRYLERVLMLTADHGPAVCGAHNTIVASRAGKDLISSLISGLCCVGDRFGGACDMAAQQFLAAFQSKTTPENFVKDMKKSNKLIMGIGHKMKSIHNPDMRVELLKTFCMEQFKETPLIEYALAVEKVTTKKKDTLILNVDGLIGVSMCDMLYGCGAFTECEAKDYIDNGCINGLFVLGRSIGFIGHFLDQKRLKQGLYRHDVDDIAYVLPELKRLSLTETPSTD